MFFSEYQALLQDLISENGTKLLKIFIISQKNNLAGDVVCICRSKFDLPKKISLLREDYDGFYVMMFPKNPSDFELPKNLVSIFRSYPWPFHNEIDESMINLFDLTFPGNGLKRSCTSHEGNFEMIGERNSKQSTGSLLVLPKKVDRHQYYREGMNLNLLPHTKNAINQLMEQSIFAGYSCGESIMNCMKKILCKRDAKSLCYNSIITQRNFCNSIHLDKKAIFSKEATQIVKRKLLDDENRNDWLQAKIYFKEMLMHTINEIPKSTTCCWKLSKTYENITMYQYFVSPQYFFGLNLSSNVLFGSNDVGATFMSSLFYHCTTIPIWKDEKCDMIFLEGPKDMYNFAWGSNGTAKEKT